MEKSIKAALIFVSALAAILLAWSFFTVSKRVSLEIKHNTADLAVSYSDVKTLSLLQKGEVREALAECRESGATSVILLPSELSEGVKEVKAAGLAFIYKADKLKEDDLSLFPYNARVIFVNNEVYDSATVLKRNFKVCFVEFYRPVGFEALDKKNILTLHTLKDEEMDALTVDKLQKRFFRAWSERRMGILYTKFKFNISGPAAGNLWLLKSLKSEIEAGGGRTAAFEENPYVLGNGKQADAKRIAALLTALLLPAAGFFAALKLKGGPAAKFLLMTAVSACAGIFISALLSDTVFMIKLKQFGGVSWALNAPVLAVLAWLTYRNWKHFTVKGLIFIGCAGAVVAALVALRSGNFSFPLFPLEADIRELLEKIFWARPRSKEFLIGHPLMLLGLYVFSNKKYEEYKLPAILALTAGMYGQVSMVNTFCHAHIPFLMSLTRTAYGLLLGGLIGAVLILCLKYLKKS